MKNILLIIALLFSVNSQATLIALSFDQTEYNNNETITGQLVASDLSYLLGGFAGTINFDPSQLALTGWSFGNGFDDGLGSYSAVDDSVAGTLYLEDFADFYADEPTIIANQGASFVLASFTFNALSSGIQTVSLLQGLEVVSFDNSQLESFAGQSVSFNVSQVPEPMSIVLLAAALVFLIRRPVS
ncbi:PEP-CTERM sorting domain-containing protein [Colwellia sp. 1_MG-2023]|uniref:PEP-CTERM sorting domain-containing protein n=1 Tax=Colwellia sp. 1_MG-2023 TaxID=3062649 RepID=UPI0026E18E8B|nr:PEP-CTERM sorting domain-containing protein [Colwellia sp. 1_MG-2023]MDO6444800.1 PEP-CTERM sorting domain-containing protein [Colwellia sp. 1_MG-2023]